jgi:hypothetical protein
MGLDYWGRDYGQSRVASVRGERAIGASRLLVQFEVRLIAAAKGEEIYYSAPGADLTISPKVGQGALAGTLSPVSTPQVFRNYEYQSSVSPILDLYLDAGRVEAIERLRAGGDLVLNGTFWARADGPQGFTIVHEAFVHPVNQSHWIEILHQMGYGRRLLIEVEAPDENADPAFAEAVKHIEAARDAMLRGKWRECVGQCRDVLEAVGLALAESNENEIPWASIGSNQKELDKPSRLRIVRRALKLLTHPARHVDDVTVRMDWEREDAVSVLSMTVAAFHYVSALRRNIKKG